MPLNFRPKIPQVAFTLICIYVSIPDMGALASAFFFDHTGISDFMNLVNKV